MLKTATRCTRLKRTNTQKDTKMKYRLHTTYEHGEFGWYVLKESTDLEEFDNEDKWVFNHILTEGVEYVKMGNFMWDIQEDKQ